MTRLFRCLAMLALAGHLLILWAAATWEPRSLYWQQQPSPAPVGLFLD